MLLSLKRAARVFAAITGWLLFDFILVYLYSVTPSVPYSYTLGSNFLDLTFVAIFLASNILVFPICLIYCRHRRRDRWIQDEAQRWLAKRSSQPRNAVGIWSSRVRRMLLFLPSFLALAVFLFEPEAMGIVSHIFDGQSDLNDHRLHLPYTSFVRSYENLYVNALIGRGIARVWLSPDSHKELIGSSMFFYANRNPRLDHDRDWIMTSANVLSRKSVLFGADMMTCADVTSNLDASESQLVHIMCLSSNNDVTADFYGLRSDLNIFYEVLKTSTESSTIRIFQSLPPRAPVL